MNQQRGIALQKKLVQEAVTKLIFSCAKEDVEDLKLGIRSIGKAWKVPENETGEMLSTIEKYRSAMQQVASSGVGELLEAAHPLLQSWTGLESEEVLEDLFNTAVELDDAEERRRLYDIAMALVDSRDFLGWIYHTKEEREIAE